MKCFYYAFQGICHLFRHERNAKIHLVAAILVIVAGFIFHISSGEWCTVILCIAGMFMGEGFNTAIEALCDKVSPQKDPLIKIAKDVAAGAVLLFAIATVIIAAIIFVPKFF